MLKTVVLLNMFVETVTHFKWKLTWLMFLLSLLINLFCPFLNTYFFKKNITEYIKHIAFL